ncbi:hypothetical protein HanXRQr2_Chr12g0563231 [Helianthus annuus]|uniref:Uncharacterized protein n=1 Tax=Helianthus annuus TaxID=4232 RepID=A0A9K3HK70_HELAN|nr:hypothetical protein HanXRQr2_Chr12g0563231 [Helianthus annuus]KAJ0864509.1 hypothetical protein HanPSC8_Chr12g0542761 [Helianthus annuus]
MSKEIKYVNAKFKTSAFSCVKLEVMVLVFCFEGFGICPNFIALRFKDVKQ